MFQGGDKAILRPTGATVEVLHRGSGTKWICKHGSASGELEEDNLQMAHPSVLATIACRNLAMESSRAEYRKELRDDLPTITRKTRNELEELLQGRPLEFNGHFKNGEDLDEDYLKSMRQKLYLLAQISKADGEALIAAANADVPLDRFVSIGDTFSMFLRECATCGVTLSFETNGAVLRVSGEPCKYPDGLPPTEWELNVPSGKLAIANDLRELFPLPEGDENFKSINLLIGCQQTTLAYAANGMSHASVGNTCPSVYKLKDGSYKIANKAEDERWDEKKQKFVKVKPKPKFEGKVVALIGTDLWWYSICDHDEFKRRCKRFKLTQKEFDATTIKVKPGVYRFRHFEDAKGTEYGKEALFSTFEWVREPDPVKDFLGSYEEVEVNAHAYVQAQVKRWPTLYGSRRRDESGARTCLTWDEMTVEQRVSSWKGVADHTLLAIGGGTDWHERGFPQATVDPTVKDIDPPQFREQISWYPFSDNYGGIYQPILAPSFVKLLFRVLESIISFGMQVRDSSHSRDVPWVRERMLKAVTRYRELMAQYPGLCDAAYGAWISEPGRAEKWVEKFELGPTFTEHHFANRKRQRWIPEDTYAITFDPRLLPGEADRLYFARNGSWSSRNDATGFSIEEWSDNQQKDPESNCFWTVNAGSTVPLYVVARIKKLGTVSHMGDVIVEIEFDYGTPWMLDPARRKGLVELGWKDAIRPLTQEEYEAALPEAVAFFESSKGVK